MADTGMLLTFNNIPVHRDVILNNIPVRRYFNIKSNDVNLLTKNGPILVLKSNNRLQFRKECNRIPPRKVAGADSHSFPSSINR